LSFKTRSSYTEPKENIFSYASLLFKHGKGRKTAWLEAEIEQGKFHGKGIIVKFKNYNDRTEAEKWIGTEIYIERSQMQRLQENDFYWHDLIGCEVINEQEIRLGQVRRILETGANDVLVLDPEDRLLPYLWGQVIKAVDVQDKKILVDWPEDYFE